MTEYDAEPEESEPQEYDPGPEVDDAGGMTEYRHYAEYQELDRAEAARDAGDSAEEAFNRRQAGLDAEPLPGETPPGYGPPRPDLEGVDPFGAEAAERARLEAGPPAASWLEVTPEDRHPEGGSEPEAGQ